MKTIILLLPLLFISCSKLSDLRRGVRSLLIGEVVNEEALKDIDVVDYKKYKVEKIERKFEKKEIYDLLSLLRESYSERAAELIVKRINENQGVFFNEDNELINRFLALHQLAETNNPNVLKSIYLIYSSFSSHNQNKASHFLGEIFDHQSENFLDVLNLLEDKASCNFLANNARTKSLIENRKKILLELPERFLSMKIFKLCLTAIQMKSLK